MVKRLLTILMLGGALSAGAQQLPNQLPNGTFDDVFVNCYPWESDKTVTEAYGTQPEGWCISNVPNSLAKSMASQVDGKNGKAVKITNTSAMSNGIPAYLTLGTSWATAETKLTSTRNKDGGVFGGIEFTHRPDAISFWYQRDNTKSNTDVSTVVAYSWKGSWKQASVPSNTAVGYLSWGSATKVDMIDRDNNILGEETATGGVITKSDDAVLVASVNKKITGNVSEWTSMEIPLEYKTTDVKPEKFNLVFAAAGYLDGGNSITDGVSLTIDDVELVYWNDLSSLKYDGEELLVDDQYSYTVTGEYEESKLIATPKSLFGSVDVSYDSETKIATVTVTREDAENKVYTIQFVDAPTGMDIPFVETLYVTVNGETGPAQDANVIVTLYDDDSFDFNLKNFILGSGEDMLPVGNIVVKGLTADQDNKFTYKGSILISAGNLDVVPEDAWFGPMLREVPLDMKGELVGEKLFVSIDIDMLSVMGQMIYVHLGYEAANMAVNAAAKYGTFCAPFEVEVPEGVEASTATLDGEKVVLTPVDDNTIPANTPVILYAEEGLEAPTIFGKPVEGTPTVGCLTGVYEFSEVPEGKYLLQKHEQDDVVVVGFYKAGAGLHLAANRCYLTAPNSAVKAYFFNEEADAINAVAVENDKEMFDLQGRKVMNAQKGIFIQNGKKVVK